jgi:uncharacterized protein YidB (DUF937 family)
MEKVAVVKVSDIEKAITQTLEQAEKEGFDAEEALSRISERLGGWCANSLKIPKHKIDFTLLESPEII